MSSNPRKHALVLLGVVSVVALQWGLFRYFGGEELFSDVPMAGLDHDTHVSQTWRVLEGLQRYGRSWVYDVQHLAGVPTGVIFDADNKGWEIFTFVFEALGASRGQAFNAFIIAAHLGVGPIVYASARLFGLRRGSAVAAAAASVLYWNFDSWSHWVWYVGMTSYAFASYLALLPLALFHRWIEERRGWTIAGCAVTLAACHLVHPYTFFILVGPMLALYLRARSGLVVREHVYVFAVAVFTVAVNAYWLDNAIRFWDYILDSSLFATTGVATLLWDTLGLVVEPAATGIVGKRTAFRTLLFIGAIAGLWGWRRQSDPRFLPFAVMLSLLVGVAYIGGHTFLAQTQPYRNVLPAGFAASIVTAAALERAVLRRTFRTASRAVKATLLAACIPIAVYLSHDVMYFASKSLPVPGKLPHGERTMLSALGHAPDPFYGYADWYDEELAAWVTSHDDSTGRFLVEGWAWGEQLTWSTNAQVLGGFIWRNLSHSWANFFRRRPQGIAKPEELRRYLDTYAVHYVIISTGRHATPWWDRSPLLRHVTDVHGFRIYAVNEPTGFIVEGPGQVRARTNLIEVTGTDPERPVELRYHWLETLGCAPDCTIVRTTVKGDPVGFIEVPAPHPADFVIENRY